MDKNGAQGWQTREDLGNIGVVAYIKGREKEMRRYSKEIATFVDDRNLLTIDTEKVQAVSLMDFHVPKGETPRPVYRPLTKVEKLEVICSSLRYGSSGILYWAFKALTLWLTKDIYPQQGRPSSSRSNDTTMSPDEYCKRH